MLIVTKNDIKTCIENSGIIEFMDMVPYDTFINYVWDNMDFKCPLTSDYLDDLFKDFLDQSGYDSYDWYN